ncbi:MAG: hypothetical protein V3V62_10345, partial [bacterium]
PARWVYFEAVSLDRLTGRCARIFDRLGVEAVSIDGGPHTQAAREVHDLLPEGAFIWRHTEGEMTVKRVDFLGVERRHVRLGREDLIDLLVEEIHGGPDAVRMPAPRSAAEEEVLAAVERHLMNLRKRRTPRAGGAEALRYEKNENHFAFAMAFAKLAEELAASEGVLVPAAGGTVPPAGPAAGGAAAPSGWIAPEEIWRRPLGRR